MGHTPIVPTADLLLGDTPLFHSHYPRLALSNSSFCFFGLRIVWAVCTIALSSRSLGGRILLLCRFIGYPMRLDLFGAPGCVQHAP